MDRDLWRRSVRLIRATEAADLGCDESAFDSNRLVVVPRPSKVLYPEYAMLVSSFGTGTVISVESPFIPWVEAHRPAKHWGAFNASFLAQLAAEIAASTDPPGTLTARSVSLGFALAEQPGSPAVPAGFRVEQRGRDWMDEWRLAEEFRNALGEPDEDDWYVRLARAFVITNETGDVAATAAVAGDGNGRMEIGVDVRRPWRGLGLARPVVLAASSWVLEQGQLPYYTCGAANIRSHLVAESCGFRPLWSISGIARAVDGAGSQTGY